MFVLIILLVQSQHFRVCCATGTLMACPFKNARISCSVNCLFSSTTHRLRHLQSKSDNCRFHWHPPPEYKSGIDMICTLHTSSLLRHRGTCVPHHYIHYTLVLVGRVNNLSLRRSKRYIVLFNHDRRSKHITTIRVRLLIQK